MILPTTSRRSVLVALVPMPTFPFALILKSEVPVLDATLNESLEPALPCTLKVMVDDVALMPAKVPLSRKRPVASDVAPVNRAR